MPKAKRMRLPNGFGQITELKSQRLRNPFRAMVTVGKTDTGKPICKLLQPQAYFKTYNDAYAALMEHHRNPYEASGDITVEELFKEWVALKEKEGITITNLRELNRNWKYCSAIYKMRIQDVRTQHIRDCVENGEAIICGKKPTANAQAQRKIKTLLNQLFDYALSYDLVAKNYARNYQIPKNIIRESTIIDSPHISYTDEEMKLLWNNVEEQEAQMILVQCYSSWRPQEIMKLKISDVDLNVWTFTGGMKTEAGKDRVVPIHPAIREIVKQNYDKAVKYNCEYLFNRMDLRSGKMVPYTYHRFEETLKYLVNSRHLDTRHRLHDGRKQFVTMCKRYDVDEYAIKRFVGHSIQDITERVYTDRDLDWYQKEMAKIKVGV